MIEHSVDVRTETGWGKAGTESLLKQAQSAGHSVCPQHLRKRALCFQDIKAIEERFLVNFY